MLKRFYRGTTEDGSGEGAAAAAASHAQPRNGTVHGESATAARVGGSHALTPTNGTGPAVGAEPGLDLLALRVDLHRILIDRINLATIDQVSRGELAETIRPMVRAHVRDSGVAINAREIDELVSDITDEMLGLGPIEPLLKDDSISDILINTHAQIYVERSGQLELTPIRFRDESHLLRVVNRIVASVGRRVDESTPMMDARLGDGSRVNVAVRPIAVDGPLVSIRKFSRRPYTLERLVENE